MSYIRHAQLLNMTIQINSAVQPVAGIPVLITYSEAIVDGKGEQVGHPQHVHRYAIQSDLTPEVLADLNAALAYMGYQIAPIEDE